MTRFAGRVAAVTGAGSGLGRALALALAERGARLAVSDVDADGLAETVALLDGPSMRVHTAIVDVTDPDAVHDWAGQVATAHGRVDQLYNNAGIAVSGPVVGGDLADLTRVLDVDFWGVVHGTRAFLPHLIASRDGHLVNISSVLGLVALPELSGYSAAKFAVRGFTEALRCELIADRHPVRVTCVHPGGVRTSIARSAVAHGADAERAARFERSALRLEPAAAAATILAGVARNRPRVLVGRDARALDLVSRLGGARYQRVVGVLARRSG